MYDRLQATIEKYVNSLALDSSAPSESAIPQDDRELSVDLNISHVNFTLWSDYVAKLALFHLHMKSIHSLVAVNEGDLPRDATLFFLQTPSCFCDGCTSANFALLL